MCCGVRLFSKEEVSIAGVRRFRSSQKANFSGHFFGLGQKKDLCRRMYFVVPVLLFRNETPA